jgi:hypothetical protein
MTVKSAQIYFVTAFLFYCAVSHAQIAELSPISTDRPSVGSGTDLVPVHSAQFENGFSWTRDQGSNAVDGPESLMRVGLSNRVELQATLPNLHWPGELPGLGFNDFSLGAKVKIGSDTQKWPLAIVGSLSFPTGSEELTSGAVDPTVLLAVGRNLPFNFQLSGSASLTSLSTNGQGRVAQSQIALSLGWCVNPRTCFFAEGAPYLSSAQSASGWISDGGMTVRIAPLLQVDWRVGTTVQDGDHSLFVSFGYSLRRDRGAVSSRPPQVQ